MFSRMTVALNDLPESQHALRTSTHLARPRNAELATVSILRDLPGYAPFSIVVHPQAPAAMLEQRRNHHEEMRKKAANQARGQGNQAKKLDCTW